MGSQQRIMSMMFGHYVNLTAFKHETLPVPEPTPDWARAKGAWHWGWQVHTYGFGGLNFLLGVYAIVAVLEFRRRLKVQQYLFGINGLLLLIGMARAVYLLVDPYESTGQVPTPVSRVLYGAAFPCLTSSFSLIQMVFMRITKVHMGPNRLHNYRVLAAIITSHFTIVIVIDVTVAYKNNLKLLLLLCQSIFITWGLILCFGFVYSGFKMSQFTTETQRVLRQLATYNRVRQETMKDGNRRELALHRISKPRIRVIDEDMRTFSCASDTSAQNSSDSLSFYNEAHMECDEEVIARAYLGRFDRGYKRGPAGRPKGSPLNAQLNKSESNADASSESEYVTDTPSTLGASADDPFSRTRLPGEPPPLQTVVEQHPDSVAYVPKSGCSSTTSILTMEADATAAFVNPVTDVMTPQLDAAPSLTSCNQESAILNHTPSHKQNGYITNIEFQVINLEDPDLNGDEAPQESGYMADTELSSPKRKRKKGRSRKKDRVEEEDCDERENASSGSPAHVPYPLRLNEGTVSLYRIRQGRVLHKVLKVTYFTTLMGFICCVLQLYAMFGVYGVLSTDSKAEPWPWFIFHTFFRTAELSMAGSMAVTTFLFGRHRHRTAVRRKHRNETQTKC